MASNDTVDEKTTRPLLPCLLFPTFRNIFGVSFFYIDLFCSNKSRFIHFDINFSQGGMNMWFPEIMNRIFTERPEGANDLTICELLNLKQEAGNSTNIVCRKKKVFIIERVVHKKPA